MCSTDHKQGRKTTVEAGDDAVRLTFGIKYLRDSRNSL